MTQRNQNDVRSGNQQANDPQRQENNRRLGGQQLDDPNRQEGKQPRDTGGTPRGVQEDDRSNRLDVTGERGAGGNRQEGNKDKQRGGGDEKAQQLKNQGQEGGKTARRDNE